MIEVVYGDKEAVADFVRTRIPDAARGWDKYTAIGFKLDGKLIAGTVFHGWSPEWGCVEMSSASDSPKWLTRETLRAIFEYPFVQLACRNVIMRVSSKNERMCSIANRFGFTPHVLPDLRGEGEDDVVFILSREALNVRFLYG